MTWIKFWPLRFRQLQSGIVITHRSMDPAFDATIDVRMNRGGYHRVGCLKSYPRDITEIIYRRDAVAEK